MSVNFYNIAIFPIYHQFGETWNLDSGCMVHGSRISLKATFYLTRAKKEQENN